MRLSYALQHSKNQGLTIEFARVSLFVVILLVSVISSLSQGSFYNWSIVGPFYGVLTLALGVHVLWVSIWGQLLEKPKVLFFGFVLDSLFISLLIYFFGLNQSLFLFLHLVNILLAGIACRGVGAVALALFTSIFFTVAALFSPEMKALNFFFLLALNNVAFFSVAGLAGYLSEQLQSVGKELKKTGLSLRSAQELNQFLLENIPSGMLSFTEQGEVVTANASALQILDKTTVTGLNWFELFPEAKSEGDVFKGVFYDRLQQSGKPEGTAFAIMALDADGALHHLGQGT
jgi:two-component system sensor histidine kinase PilS (NtrC family)